MVIYLFIYLSRLTEVEILNHLAFIFNSLRTEMCSWIFRNALVWSLSQTSYKLANIMGNKTDLKLFVTYSHVSLYFL